MTNKIKNNLLIAGFIISLFICYQLAFSRTLQIKNTYDQLIKEESIYSNTPKSLSILKQKEKYYDSILVKYQLSGGSIQNTLLQNINKYADKNRLKIISFSEPHISVQNEMTIKSYQFSLEGEYNSLINLIYKLEQQTKFGEIVNVHFEKKQNYRTGKNYLQVHIFLKSLA